MGKATGRYWLPHDIGTKKLVTECLIRNKGDTAWRLAKG